jgi:hypothetical protein
MAAPIGCREARREHDARNQKTDRQNTPRADQQRYRKPEHREVSVDRIIALARQHSQSHGERLSQQSSNVLFGQSRSVLLTPADWRGARKDSY